MLSVLVATAMGLTSFAKLEVTMPIGKDSAESVARLINGFGRVLSRNRGYGTFTIELNGKVSAEKAIAKLKPKVERVRFDDFRHGERELDRNSRRDVDRYIADLHREAKLEGESEDLEEELEAFGMIQHRLQRRAYPRDTYDPLAYRKAAIERERIPERPQTDAPGGGWVYQGPRNLSNIGGSATTFRVSGRATAAAFSPTAPDTTYYVGTANGGVWKTTNGGTSWTPLTDDWPYLQVSDIQIDPTNLSRIYVASGDAHSEESYGLGLMRSLDGGTTWAEVGATVFNGAFQEKILIDPDNTDFVTVAAADGLYRSTNGGTNWSKVSTITSRVFDVSCGSPTTTNNRYYYACGVDGQIWRSTNRGSSWTRILNNAATYGHIRALACSVVNDDTLYAICDERMILKSTDYGATWSTSLTSGFPHHREVANQDYKQWSQVGFDYQMSISKRTALGFDFDVVYVGLFDLSMYSGGNWYEIGGTLTLTQPNPPIHCDNHNQAIHPTNPDKSLVTTDGGVYLVTRNSDNTVTVNNLNTNIYNYELWHMNAHPTDTLTMLGGIQHQGSAWSDGPVTVWDMANRGDGAYCVISPTNGQKQFTSIQNYNFDGLAHLSRTLDGWNSSDGISVDIGPHYPAFIPPLVADPNNGNRIYLGGQYLSRYNDNGLFAGTIDALLGGFRFSGVICTIAIAPTDSNRIYVGIENGDVYRSSDFGGSWTKISNAGLPTAKIESISVSLTNSSNITVTLGGVGIGDGHVYRCLNTTAATPTWEDRSGTGARRLPDLPMQTLCRDPNTDDWYAGGESGCYFSNDFGATWYSMTGDWGLPNVEVTMLHAPGNGYLYASTFGRGIWKMPLGSADSALASVNAGTNAIVGGPILIGTVSLNQVAPPVGAVVNLSSNDSAATVPSSVSISPAQSSANFSINTSPVTADRTVTITAARLGVTKTDSFTLQTPGVVGLSGPTELVNGLSGSYTVTLNGVAPTGGAVVALQSATVAIQVPASMTIPAGQSTGTFVATSSLVNSDALVALTASRSTLFRNLGVTVMRYRLASFTTAPVGFYSGDSFVGTVTLDRAAPSGGAQVPLFASDGGSVPATVSIPAGQVSGTFNGSAPIVAIDQSANFEARLSTNIINISRTVRAAILESISVSPTTVRAGTTGTGRVTLRGKAAGTGLVVRIRLVRPNGFLTTTPGFVTVPNGSDSINFPIQVTSAPRAAKAIVYGILNGSQKSDTFGISP